MKVTIVTKYKFGECFGIVKCHNFGRGNVVVVYYKADEHYTKSE